MKNFSVHLLPPLLFIVVATPCGRAPQQQIQEDAYGAHRSAMVEIQIAARGISDTAVLRAMRSVPRHKFVPREEVGSAYEDRPLPIGEGQTISQPYIVGLMTELLRPAKHHRVLEVGTGSGYQAAVLAEIVDTVYSIEIVRVLAESARERLRGLGYRNVRVIVGDGYEGWPEHAPFDGIIVTAAADQIPEPLIAQLKDGGRMVIPAGEAWGVQELLLIEKKDGKVSTQSVLPVRFVPLIRKK